MCSKELWKNSFYVYLSSGDSKEYFPDNKSHSFITKLQEALRLERDCWEVALTEIYWPGNGEPDEEILNISSDLVVETLCGGVKSPLLRKIVKAKGKGMEFTTPYYMPLRVNEINSFQVVISTGDERDRPFEAGDLHCTLHFRKKDE